ncbi:MAG: polyprenyl diphosphate synthase, partial [Acidimicrobiia bacterium]|nr:polyprenyl diphosphate synthase [Acidimicrobiia bacterium]
MSDDSGVIPRHVGLILDGNGRWANARGLPRTAGHQAGEATLFEVIRVAGEIGVEWLTAFTFSTENWNRSEEEVAFLMWFNEDILIRRREDLHAWGMRIHFAGDTDDPRIPERNREHMAESVRLTAANSGMNVVFAFNYGSRWEIVEAARRVAADAATGRLAPEDLDAGVFQRYL